MPDEVAVDKGVANQRWLVYGVDVAVAASEYSKGKERVAVAEEAAVATVVFTSVVKGA